MSDTDPQFAPEIVAANKRMAICALGETDWQQWRHHPVTAGYLQYLDDTIAFYRNAVADILEAGQFAAGDVHQDKNPDCLRGQIVMLRAIHTLQLGQIKAFYGKEEEEEEGQT